MKTLDRAAVVAFVSAVSLLPATAHAYLDPATGSMLLQAALASLFAGLLAVKLYWRRLVSLFSRARNDSEVVLAEASDDEPSP